MTSKLSWQQIDDIAANLGASGAARRKWRQRASGVPHEWRIRIWEHLKSAGREVPFAAFDDIAAARRGIEA